MQDRCNSHCDNNNMGFETHARMHRLAKKPGIGLKHKNKKKRKLTSGRCISFTIIHPDSLQSSCCVPATFFLFQMYFTFVNGSSKLFGIVSFGRCAAAVVWIWIELNCLKHLMVVNLAASYFSLMGVQKMVSK